MQILNFIISACSFVLLLFSVHLFFAKQGNQLLNRILATILFSRFGQILIYLLVTSNHTSFLPLLQNLFIPFYLVAPACLYFYITGFVIDRSHLTRKDWFHAIPFVLAIIHVFPESFLFLKNGEALSLNSLPPNYLLYQYKSGVFSPYFYTILKPILELGYLMATWYVVLSSSILKTKGSDIKKTWVMLVLLASTSFKFLSFIALIFGGTQHPFAAYPWFVALNSLGLLIIIVFVLHQPKLLYGYIFVSTNWNTVSSKPEPTEEVSTHVNPKSISIADPLLSVYTKVMTDLMRDEKPFLMPDFQIIHLAQKLNIPTHHCSYVVNNVIGKNFREWINSYRVNYFISMYPSLSNKMTVEAVANLSGFKNITTFYSAFKKETGLMPTTYFATEENAIT